MARHIKVVNGLGYDAFAFNLEMPLENRLVPVASDGKIGWKHCYARQIEELLNMLPGKKIVFSFSNPAAAAIEAMFLRNCQDIHSLICDSGPSAHLGLSALRLVKKYLQEKKYKDILPATSLIGTWSFSFHRDIHQHLAAFPAHFPILSIRGWKDELISPSEIDQVFEPHKQLKWIKLSLPEAQHLNGLKNFPNEYLNGLKSFLAQ